MKIEVTPKLVVSYECVFCKGEFQNKQKIIPHITKKHQRQLEILKEFGIIKLSEGVKV